MLIPGIFGGALTLAPQGGCGSGRHVSTAVGWVAIKLGKHIRHYRSLCNFRSGSLVYKPNTRRKKNESAKLKTASKVICLALHTSHGFSSVCTALHAWESAACSAPLDEHLFGLMNTHPSTCSRFHTASAERYLHPHCVSPPLHCLSNVTRRG